jgi:hypothetical protein
VPPNASSDRYEPLPGITQIPAFLYRKLGPRGRRAAKLAGAVLVVALAAGIVFGLPAITTTKEERAAAEQKADAERRAERVVQLQAEVRLLRGRGEAARGLEGAAALSARHALAGDLAAAVQQDAVARVRAGEFTQSVDRVECERFPRAADGADPADDLGSRTGSYSCLAITADAPAVETNEGSSLGYPYRALVDFTSGRFGYCKVSGRAGEGSLVREIPVPVPSECGGTS